MARGISHSPKSSSFCSKSEFGFTKCAHNHIQLATTRKVVLISGGTVDIDSALRARLVRQLSTTRAEYGRLALQRGKQRKTNLGQQMVIIINAQN
jgi:phosphopantothenoylcysteine synthetase/decarboxylase